MAAINVDFDTDYIIHNLFKVDNIQAKISDESGDVVQKWLVAVVRVVLRLMDVRTAGVRGKSFRIHSTLYRLYVFKMRCHVI